MAKGLKQTKVKNASSRADGRTGIRTPATRQAAIKRRKS